MKAKSVVVVDRTELKKVELRLAASYSKLLPDVEALEALGEIKDLPARDLEKYLGLLRERGRLEGPIIFIRELLEEEEVKPEDYGVPCAHIG